MKKWQFLIILAVVAAVGMFWTLGWDKIRDAQEEEQSLEVVKQSHQVGSFDRIEAVGPLTVELVNGTEEPVVIQTEAWFQPSVTVRVEGGTLKILVDTSLKNTVPRKGTEWPKVVVGVQTSGLVSAELRGAVNLKLLGRFYSQPQPMKLELLGGSSLVAGDINVPQLDLEITGASSAELQSFTGHTLEADTDAGSTLNIRQITCTTAELEASAASTVVITSGTASALTVDANAASTIKAAGVKAASTKAIADPSSTCSVAKE